MHVLALMYSNENTIGFGPHNMSTLQKSFLTLLTKHV